ncbi:hypothetical protein ACP4OV_010105 [Aristida adscensionis]
MCTTEDCVMMFSILSPPTSTTGRLFILYLDSRSNIVRNVSDVCSARNGAHRKLPEISPTYRSTTSVRDVLAAEFRGSEGFKKASTN